MRALAVVLSVAFVSSSAWAGKPAAQGRAEPINVTGAWTPKYWTLKIGLLQDGHRVVGANVGGPVRDHFFRGQWDGARLVLVVNKIDAKHHHCEPRGVFVLTSAGGVQALDSSWIKEDGKVTKGPWTRASADAGDTFLYPWEEELKYCGMLRTYELVFESGSDGLEGNGWPILEGVAAVLKADPTVKIQVLGHTDSMGADEHNQALSEKRAESLKKALVEKYGADAARISTKGAGESQPIGDNKTDEGRAINRRVEIVLAH